MLTGSQRTIFFLLDQEEPGVIFHEFPMMVLYRFSEKRIKMPAPKPARAFAIGMVSAQVSA